MVDEEGMFASSMDWAVPTFLLTLATVIEWQISVRFSIWNDFKIHSKFYRVPRALEKESHDITLYYCYSR